MSKPLLRNCPACNHQVATDAKNCPNCGKPMFKGMHGGLLFLIIIGVIACAFIFIFLQVSGFFDAIKKASE